MLGDNRHALRRLALLGPDRALRAVHRARVRDLLAARRASRGCKSEAWARAGRDRHRQAGARRRRGGPRPRARRSRPLGSGTIRRAGRRARRSTPSPRELADTLSGYGLGLRARALARRPARARGAPRGLRPRAGGGSLPSQHPVHPLGTVAPAPTAAGWRSADRARHRRHAGRDRRRGARRAPARRRRAARLTARAGQRAGRGDPVGADRDAGAAERIRRRAVHGVRPARWRRRRRAQGWPLARRRRRGRGAHAGSSPSSGATRCWRWPASFPASRRSTARATV